MDKYDVIVVGGGSAGLGAAISAGRAGAKTLLVERYGIVGGMATAGLTSHWDPIKMVGVKGLALEYYETLKAGGNFLEFPFEKIDPATTMWEGGCTFDMEEYIDLSLKLLREANVDIMLHTQVIGVAVDNARVKKLIAYNTGKAEIEGDIFVDATGDANVSYLAGAKYEKAPKEQLQSATLMFKIAGVNLEKMLSYLEENPDEFGCHPRLGRILKDPRRSTNITGFRSRVRAAYENGDLSVILPEQGVLLERMPRDGEFRVNCTHTENLDCTDGKDLIYAQISERMKIRELISFFRKYIPGCEECYLAQSAVQIGVRETRRIIGDYQLTIEDIKEACRFEDAVVEAEWAHSDIHSPDGTKWSFKMHPGPYQIPYRCFLPQGIENLYAAGRCISCDRAAFASVRIQLVTMAMGQAVGTAAALAVKTEGKATRQVSVQELRRLLKEAGCRV